jgi:hypothetical protein
MIARYEPRIAFPSDRDGLLDAAVRQRAPVDVLDALRRLPPDVEFASVEEIWEALGGVREARF